MGGCLNPGVVCTCVFCPGVLQAQVEATEKLLASERSAHASLKNSSGDLTSQLAGRGTRGAAGGGATCTGERAFSLSQSPPPPKHHSACLFTTRPRADGACVCVHVGVITGVKKDLSQTSQQLEAERVQSQELKAQLEAIKSEYITAGKHQDQHTLPTAQWVVTETVHTHTQRPTNVA